MSRIALISPGAMGSAVAGCLTEAGHEVLTSLAGRSPATHARAEAAGMTDAADDALAIDQDQDMLRLEPLHIDTGAGKSALDLHRGLQGQ